MGLSVNRRRQTAKKIAARRTVRKRSFIVYKLTKNWGSIAQQLSHLKGLGTAKTILERHNGLGNRQRQTVKNIAPRRTVKERRFLVCKRTQY